MQEQIDTISKYKESLHDFLVSMDSENFTDEMRLQVLETYQGLDKTLNHLKNIIPHEV